MVTVKSRNLLPLITFSLTFCCYFDFFCNASDTLGPGEYLKDSQTLVSAGGVFELGFFVTNVTTTAHYLGIWFKNDKNKKPVWVANRDNPVPDDTRRLVIRDDGNLVISDGGLADFIINSGDVTMNFSTTAKLNDSGNLILENGNHTFWQSFSFPTDTLLPGMKLGWDSEKGRSCPSLTSWVSPLVPTSGGFGLGLHANNTMKVLDVWDVLGNSKQIGFSDNNSSDFILWSSLNRYTFTYDSSGFRVRMKSLGQPMSWWVLTSTGVIDEFTLVDNQIVSLNHSLCVYGTDANSTGCAIPMPMSCGIYFHFVEISGKMPSSSIVRESGRMGISDCERICRSNCSCKAYATLYNDRTGCEFYYGDGRGTIDIIGKGNRTIYIREDALQHPDSRRKSKLVLPIILPVVFLWIAIFVVLFISLLRRKYRRKIIDLPDTYVEQDNDAKKKNDSTQLHHFCSYAAGTCTYTLDLGKRKSSELPVLSFSCLVTATEDFAAACKIGEGGFGSVYRGVLLGYEIAVKRLSGASEQGVEEFKSEVHLISKVQHMNLVRLLGYCVEREEKILIYEYLPNKSLDSFIFDRANGELLDWRKRIQIIEGIAQGLLYLHKYSRLKIIHRDLKSSNILLDAHMNPKISDFGLARIFDEAKSLLKTKKVAGTFGYMSPEYAAQGVFSTSSDVFSFGVIMLEIISGKRNTTFCEPIKFLTLLGYAWELWRDGRLMKLIDPTISTCSFNELMLLVQIALLCVQEKPGDRPTMSDVILMLSKERAALPVPKEPAFSSHFLVDGYPAIEEKKPSDYFSSLIEH